MVIGFAVINFRRDVIGSKNSHEARSTSETVFSQADCKNAGMLRRFPSILYATFPRVRTLPHNADEANSPNNCVLQVGLDEESLNLGVKLMLKPCLKFC